MTRLIAGMGLVAVLRGPVSAQNRPLSAESLRPHAREWSALLAAEDARAATPAQLELLRSALQSSSAELRRTAVRGLGRLERADQVLTIAPLLYDAAPAVRAEAAHALAQSVHLGNGGAARGVLQRALPTARDVPAVLAAVAESLARLRGATVEENRAIVQSLLPYMMSPAEARLGVLRGFYFMSRQPNMRGAFDSTAAAALRGEIGNSSSNDVTAARARTLAVSTLVAIGAGDAATLNIALSDGAPLVRREAVLGANAIVDTAIAGRLLRSAMSDNSGIVRYDALRIYARRFAAAGGCDAVVRATSDADPNVALHAIDQLGGACSAHPRALALLDSIARARPRNSSHWQPAAHAVAALASADSARARVHLRTLAAHRNMFARSYAARSAGALKDTALLRRLARDESTLVRTAAVQALARTAGHAADDVYVAQLALNDSELLMAATAALEKSTRPGAAIALVDALDRITRLRSETSRDGRQALLTRAGELGTQALEPRLRPYLRDFDPSIAKSAADIIERWSGTRPEQAPRPLAPPKLPSFEDLAKLERARVTIEMADGAAIELRMLPFEAPTNAFRFARLARAGYFNGLTFHRIVPNFVIQGGSPGASEYSGDAAFSRDELGWPNWRGTVGLSTRGRDTGDAQIYFNIIDNVRLDHDYTVYAEVVSGMEFVDALREGAQIRRIRVR